MSSDLEQNEREDMLPRFRSRRICVLVSADILSRGFDIKGINLVINIDVPSDADDYVHRVGRTARAETTGMAVSLVNKTDIPKIRRIEKLIGNKLKNIPLPAYIAANHDHGSGQRSPAMKPGGKNRLPLRKNYPGN